jgi:5-methylcytosine-specific restriction protein B
MPEFILATEAVRKSIDVLLNRRIHPAWAAYLCLNREATLRGREGDLSPDFKAFFNHFLRVKGGPIGKPYYRPFWHQSKSHIKAWYQENVAGSFSPNSARRIQPLMDVVDLDGERFSLPSGHSEAALQYLLYNRAIPVVPLVAYLYREFSFDLPDPPQVSRLVALFREEFGFVSTAGESAFNRLFEMTSIPGVDDGEILVPWEGAPFSPASRFPQRSAEIVRPLDAEELGITLSLIVEPGLEEEPAGGVGEDAEELDPASGGPPPLTQEISNDDPYLQQVRDLFDDGFAGVVLRGPPGTSKSWYARQIAAALVGGDTSRVRFVQFHPSYQYEDFVEGFVPKATGTFALRPKHFLWICREARRVGDDSLCILVIDELSRSDPARVFGEVLTYIETTKREVPFRLASGREFSVPSNLRFLATMNDQDRGIDEVDAALERRFASIFMPPDAALLEQLLVRNGVGEELRGRIRRFFEELQGHREPAVRIGHAFFSSVRGSDTLQRLWDHQLRFVLERAFPLGKEGFSGIERRWKRIVLEPAQAEVPGPEVRPLDAAENDQQEPPGGAATP